MINRKNDYYVSPKFARRRRQKSKLTTGRSGNTLDVSSCDELNHASRTSDNSLHGVLTSTQNEGFLLEDLSRRKSHHFDAVSHFNNLFYSI